MGILKTGLKLVGSVALGATGVASTVLRGMVSATGNDGLADAIEIGRASCRERVFRPV